MDKETSKNNIAALIEKYKKVIDEKRLSIYNEEMTKKDFILPLFRALGWDIEDSSEVTAEEKISKKRVDYGFKINGIPKFFLEVKKLKEDLLNTKFGMCLAHLKRGIISPYFNADFTVVNMEGSKTTQFKAYINTCA